MPQTLLQIDSTILLTSELTKVGHGNSIDTSQFDAASINITFVTATFSIIIEGSDNNRIWNKIYNIVPTNILVNGIDSEITTAGNFTIKTPYKYIRYVVESITGIVNILISGRSSFITDTNSRGPWDASGSINAVASFPATGGSGVNGGIFLDDVWIISVPGFVGGTAVIADAKITALINDPGQVMGNWHVVLPNVNDPGVKGLAGATGPAGATGARGVAGIAGPTGPASIIDYQHIIAQVLLEMATPKVLSSIAISGSNSVVGGTINTYTLTAMYTDTTTAVILSNVTWTAANGLGSVTNLGVVTTPVTLTTVNGTLSASYTQSGVTKSATYAVAVTPVVVASVIYPFYGVENVNSVKDATLITSLVNRGLVGDLTGNITLNSGDAGSNLTMFYAYPVSYGLAKFEDQAALGFFGGWDAATGDIYAGATGPMTINVTLNEVVVPFYLYQTDNVSLGSKNWVITHP